MKLKKNHDAARAFRKAIGKDNKNPIVYEKPVRIISKPPAQFTEDARNNNVNGTVTIVAELKSDGKVGFVVPHKMLPWGLTDAALEQARRIQFEPAVKNGRPITTIVIIEYFFYSTEAEGETVPFL